MKTHQEVRDRILQIFETEIAKRLEEASSRLPVNCTHNYRHKLDVRPRVLGSKNPSYNRVSGTVQTIGLCMYGLPETWEAPQDADPKWNGDICEDPVDAQRCPYFNQKWTRENTLESLSRDLSNPEWVQEKLPELATLAWVLAEPVKIPWYRRWWLILTRSPSTPLVETSLSSLLHQSVLELPE